MNKIIVSGILIITLLTSHDSMYSSAIINIGAAANQPAANRRAIPAEQNPVHQPENNAYENIYTIEELRRRFIAQPTHAAKAEFIARVLEHEIEPVNQATQPITVGQQLVNAQNLKTIIQQEIYLKSGYVWNSSENKPEIEWLENQMTLIDHKISLLKWQSRSFGAQTLWTTAKWLAIYLGVIAIIYAVQPYIESSYNSLHPNKEKYKPKSIGELAVLGPNTLWDTTSQAVGYTYTKATSPAVQDAIKTSGYAAAQAGSNLMSGLTDIGSKGGQFLKEKSYNTVQGIAEVLKPNKASNKNTDIPAKGKTTGQTSTSGKDLSSIVKSTSKEFALKPYDETWYKKWITEPLGLTNFFENFYKSEFNNLEENYIQQKNMLEDQKNNLEQMKNVVDKQIQDVLYEKEKEIHQLKTTIDFQKANIDKNPTVKEINQQIQEAKKLNNTLSQIEIKNLQNKKESFIKSLDAQKQQGIQALEIEYGNKIKEIEHNNNLDFLQAQINQIKIKEDSINKEFDRQKNKIENREINIGEILENKFSPAKSEFIQNWKANRHKKEIENLNENLESIENKIRTITTDENFIQRSSKIETLQDEIKSLSKLNNPNVQQKLVSKQKELKNLMYEKPWFGDSFARENLIIQNLLQDKEKIESEIKKLNNKEL
ncbi:MAG: hypothetical protein ACXWL5_02390 [Candidatus Chromulinivorax sp.]